MNKEEFIKAAKKKHIPFFYFNLDETGRDDERFNLVREGEKWNVYYSERGVKTTNKYFDSESEALEYMLSELSDEV